MKPKNRKQMLPSILASLTLLGFGVTFTVMFSLSQYTLFRLCGIFLLMMAAVNLILIIFGKRPKDIEESREVPEEPLEAKAEAKTEAETESEETEKKKRRRTKERLDALDKHTERLFKRLGRGVARIFAKASVWLTPLLLAVAIIVFLVWFGASLWAQPTGNMILAYWHLALVAIFFVIAVIGDNLCKNAETEDTRYAMLNRNACLFFKLTKLIMALLALPLALSLLQIYHIHKYVGYILAALFYYAGVMIIVSLAVRTFKRELVSAPGVVVLLPFLGGDVKELAVLSFLEENTGITLRSLWSLKFVKSILPYSIIAAALLFWGSTGIVYVQSQQEAAVYRMGVLREETLKPGLHMTLPYPLDTNEIYDTATVNKVTIGYKASENQDNVWTEGHGDSEYRLLLGSGKELVSINLRLEYRIGDLEKYLRNSAAPDKILEAKAYELVTAKTINTDLQTILSTDRESFSKNFHDEIAAAMTEVDTGIEVVSVVLESIHPPVEIADVYQNFIAAEIRAQKYILDAEATAAEIRAEGETLEHELINYAKIDKYERVAAATTEINTFMASVSASEKYPDEYKYYKYLDALSKAYGNARLVIVGDNIDGSRLYFGSIPKQEN